MNWLYEQPLPIVVMGAVLCVVLLAGFIKTGHKLLLPAAAAVVLIVLALLALERSIVTDREQVEQTLFEIADAVERNDIDAALRYISPEAPGVDHANAELRRIRFDEVDIKRNLEIEVFPDRTPPTAETRFNVVVVANIGLGMERYPRYVEVTFTKQGERWLASDYQHYEPTRGMRSNSP